MKKKLSVPKTVGIGLSLIQFAASALLVVKFKTMGFLPDKLLYLLAGALFIMFLLTFSVQFVKGLHWGGKLISILMIVLLVFGLHYVREADSALKNVTDNTVQNKIEKDRMVVIVLETSTYETLNDLKGKNFGVQYRMDPELNGRVVDDCKDRLDNDLVLTAYDNYSVLFPELLRGKVDAMIMNSTYLDIIDEYTMEEDGSVFSQMVRVVEYFDYETVVAETEQASESETEEEKPFVITEDPFIIYISGIDTYGDIKTKSRSDVNIMLVVNPASKQILMVTTPRDSFVVIPGVSLAGKDKLTHAGIYGVEKSVETIESIYDIDIRYNVRVNFTSLISIVDALGGVDVYSAYTFSVGKYNFVEGMNYMDGEKALVFARERHSFADGDNQRGRDQLEIIRAIIKKCTNSTAILTGFSNIMNTVSKQVQTSLTSDEIYSLVKMQIEDKAEWQLFSYACRVTSGREYCYSYPWKALSVGYLNTSDVSKAKAAIEKMLDGETLTATDVIQ